MLGAARAVITSAKPAAAGITVGTTGFLSHNSANQSSYTFSSGLTVDGGGAALLLAALWLPAFGNQDEDFNAAPTTFTLNGNSYDTLITPYLQNTSTNKYVQASVAIWNSPAAGDIVFDAQAILSMSGCGLFFMNLSGLHATQPGALVRDQFTVDSTSLPFQITTQHANSLLLSILGTRDLSGPFTFDDGAMTVVGRTSGAGDTDGDFAVAYRNGLAASTYNAGGDSNLADDNRFAGMAVELRAA